MALRFQRRLQYRFHSDGYALPIAMALAIITMTLMSVSLLEAQSNRDSSHDRQTSGGSAIVSDSAIARVLVELAKPENGVLLTRNYDPKNPATGKNYLGKDGTVNSGDETSSAVDEWTDYTPSMLPCYQALGYSDPTLDFISGSIGSQGTYKVLAYRYDAASQIGNILVEGAYQNTRSQVLLSLSISPILDTFPGIGLIKPVANYQAGMLALRNRQILGGKGNVYFVSSRSNDSTLTGKSEQGDTNRSTYLDAIWSAPEDGATTDTVSGSIVACDLNINIPEGTKGTNFGVINTSATLWGKRETTPTFYQLEKVDLAGTDTLTIDTTGGPVVIDMMNPLDESVPLIRLREQAKILNVRTDGQPPKVGDVRLMIRSNNQVLLYDRSCMQQVFLYSWTDELRLLTSGPGCPSGQNTNFEGVAWVEAILSSKNAESNRNVQYLNRTNQSYDTIVTPGATSGIAVPDDVSSLVDLLKHSTWPLTYRYGAIKNWQQVRL